MIITIDGPAGSGKSTTARAVAKRMGYVYLDTGAMYRALALAFLQAEAPPTPQGAADVLPNVRVDIRYLDDSMQVLLNGTEVSGKIRTGEVGKMASQISALPAVREKLLGTQRRVGREQAERHGGVVLDGRDTGTVVFPGADLKIFMIADAEERARRRLEEYNKDGDAAKFDDVLAEIEARDEADRNRDIAPLKRAQDAIDLDTTSRSIEEQVDAVVEKIHTSRAASEG